MSAAVALAQVIIPMLPTIAGDISDLVKWISGVRAAARQTGEWTAEMDNNFRRSLVATGSDHAAQLEA